MATALFVVRASIAPEQEEAFNRWYNSEHCPQALQYPGAVSARRYKAIRGEDRYQYIQIPKVMFQPAPVAAAHFAHDKDRNNRALRITPASHG